jgi:hypothetical protein
MMIYATFTNIVSSPLFISSLSSLSIIIIGRKVEYIHHILCGGFGIASGVYYPTVCTFIEDPFIQFMLAELSTPLLILWRINNSNNNTIYILFIIIFFFIRLLYHGLYLVPLCYMKCDHNVALFFGSLYNIMNVFFFIMILMKLYRSLNKNSIKIVD